MTLPLPRPTNETYIDFLKRKLRGRNVSPEFRQRYPALFDSVQQTTSEPVANWETYYRQAKPTTSIQNNDDGMGNTDGLFNPNDLSREYLDSFIANVQNAPQNIARSFERGFNELTTGLPDVRSNESILAERDANRVAGEHWDKMDRDQLKSFYDENPGKYLMSDRGQESAVNVYTPKSLEQYPYFSPGLFDMTDTLMKDEFDNLEKWGWGPGITPVKGSDYVDTLDRGLFSGLGSFGEKLGGAIQEEIVNPIKSGVDEFTSFVKDPSQYVEDKWNSMSTENVVPKGAGMLGKVGAGFLGLGQIPATMVGYGIGKIAEMMMSEGGGQIGMPGTVMSDYWGGQTPTVTQSTIHGFANVPGVGVVAVNALGQPLGGAAGTPQEGVYSRGGSSTSAGQAAYETKVSNEFMDSIMDDFGGTGYGMDPDPSGEDQGLEEERMATNPIKTLFGDTEDDLLRQMRMEDQERVNQARLLDKQSGGNYYSGLIADAAQQQANVFSNLLPKGVRAVGGLLGQEDAAGKIAAGMEDPRLGKARQRKADLDMLSKKYETLGTDEDGFTDKDAKVIVDDLISLGYLDEAKKMAEIWQGRRLADAKMASAKTGGGNRYKTEKIVKHRIMSGPNTGKEVLRLVVFDKQTGNTNIGWSDETGKKIAAPTGELSALNALDQTEIDVLENRKEYRNTVNFYAKDLASHKGKVDKNTAQYREKLERKTNELQKDLNVDEHKSKIMAEAQLATREENLQKGNEALRTLPQVQALLELAKARKAGGDISAAWARLKRVFGREDMPDARFRTGTQMLMIENLNKIFGPKATDKDLEELRKAFAQEGQPSEANIAILEKWVERTRTAKDIGDYWIDNPEATSTTYSKWLRDRYEKIPDDILVRYPNATLEGGRVYIIKDGYKLEIKKKRPQ